MPNKSKHFGASETYMVGEEGAYEAEDQIHHGASESYVVEEKFGKAKELVLYGSSDSYVVGQKVGEAATFRLYNCMSEMGKRKCLLKIATAVEHNGTLLREVYHLHDMRREAADLEVEYARVKKDPKAVLNYHLAFPEVVDNFIVSVQDARRAVILAFESVDDLSNLVPIGHITSRDRVRVDAKTSAWIMGKTLKILDFAHNYNIAVVKVTPANILIERDRHFVAIFDWTQAVVHAGGVPQDTRRAEIASAASAVIRLLGGDPTTGSLPPDTHLTDVRYEVMLHNFAQGRESDAGKAHTQFYRVICELWPERMFYPYTSYPLSAEPTETEGE